MFSDTGGPWRCFGSMLPGESGRTKLRKQISKSKIRLRKIPRMFACLHGCVRSCVHVRLKPDALAWAIARAQVRAPGLTQA